MAAKSLISIRRSLLTNLVPAVLLLGFGIFAMMALSTRRAVQELSSSLIRQASQRTELKLQSFFEPVDRQVEAMRTWGELGLLDLDTTDRLRTLLSPLMQEFPWSSAVFIADSAGREYLLRRSEDIWSSRQMWRDAWGDRAVVHRWRPNQPGSEEVGEETLGDYDPRQRPWYQGAAAELVEAEQTESSQPVYWTEPYTFYSSGRPGITAATAFRDSQQRPMVVGIDISLTEISRFTNSIELLEDSTVFVVTEDGRMIGIPRRAAEAIPDRDLESLLLLRPEDLGTTAAQDAAQKLIDDIAAWGRPLRMVSDREVWWGEVTPFELSSELKLLIGVAVGERAILGQLETQRYWVIGMTLAALALAVWRAVQMARGYSRPVEALAEESERISRGDLDPGPALRTRIAEVHQLAEAHDRMRDGLRTLLKLERDLQVARQIQQSTLPAELPELPGIELSAWSQPADETGGDTYDVIGLRSDASGAILERAGGRASSAVLMLADATGHGIGPALSVTQLRAMLRMAVRLSADLTTVVTYINQQLAADLPTGRFITAWFAYLDTADYSLATFSTGQAPLLRFIAATGEFEVLDSHAVPLGLFPTLKVSPPEPLRLAPGDLYVVMSDGFFEAKDSRGIEQGTDRLCQVIREHSRQSAEIIQQKIRQATDAFTNGAPPDDDRTILVLKRA